MVRAREDVEGSPVKWWSPMSEIGQVKVGDALLFNYFVGTREHCRRNFEAECPCCLEVDDESKPCGLDHWKIGRLLTLENSPNVNTHLAISVYKVVSVTNESAGFGEFA